MFQLVGKFAGLHGARYPSLSELSEGAHPRGSQYLFEGREQLTTIRLGRSEVVLVLISHNFHILQRFLHFMIESQSYSSSLLVVEAPNGLALL